MTITDIIVDMFHLADLSRYEKGQLTMIRNNLPEDMVEELLKQAVFGDMNFKEFTALCRKEMSVLREADVVIGKMIREINEEDEAKLRAERARQLIDVDGVNVFAENFTETIGEITPERAETLNKFLKKVSAFVLDDMLDIVRRKRLREDAGFRYLCGIYWRKIKGEKR